MKKGNLIVGLDVGTSKVCTIVGETHTLDRPRWNPFSRDTDRNGALSMFEQVEIIGVGHSPSRGLRKGVVVNIEDTVESIRKAVETAETMADVEIKGVHVGITGGHIQSFSSHGVIAVKEKDINQREVEKVIDAARAMAIPFDREVLHVMPVGFAVDGQNGIHDPRGMTGVRLEVNVRIITGAVASVQNLIKSCHMAGLEIIDIVLDPLAVAAATLSSEEKELGVGIVDMGAGTTDIALFHQGSLCHTAVLSIGGNNFTNDVAIGLRITASEAEKIKKKYGYSQLSMIKENDAMDVVYPGDKQVRKIPRQLLIEILQPRAEEILSLVKDEIVKSGYHGLMTSGVVLTGGTVLMPGMNGMAENILELPVRIGSPRGFGGMHDISSNPMFITAAGLVLYGRKEIVHERHFHNESAMLGMSSKMKGWVKGIF
ncbi:MAG: cell division protein FtsA [Nitrospiraceae bacterium]|nr:MAG: cell division protein FtsA [Nitrospiraceae bacterium]